MKFQKITKIIVFIILLTQINDINAQETKCKACNEIIDGKYIVIDGKAFHPNHFVCAKCNKPLTGNYYKKNGKYFDAQCYANSEAPRCAVCDQPLTGKYLIDPNGLKYHQTHEKELSRCDNCNRLISQKTTKGGVKYSDGRSICNICKKNAVTTEAEYTRSQNKTLLGLKNYGLNISLDNVEVHAVDRIKLKKVSNKYYSNSARGYCQTTVEERNSGLTSEVIRTHTIYVLDKVPPKYIELTLAHELMHVWINENVEHKLSSKLEEGSCNFIAYTYMKSDYSVEAQNILKQMQESPDPIYGDGFRKVYNNFKGKYLSELLNYLKRYKTL